MSRTSARLRRAIRRLALPLACLVAGAITTIAIALGLAHFSAPPESWRFLNENLRAYLSGHEEFFEQRPEKESLVILDALGPGFRVMDLQYFDARTVHEAPRPPWLRRWFITEVGWPSPALVTHSPDIGRRFYVDKHLVDGPFIGDDAWRMLPRGFVFNTLLFAVLWFALLAFLRPEGRTCGLPAIVVCCIGAALWMPVGIAWGAYSLHNPGVYTFFTLEAARYEAALGPIVRPAHDVPWNSFEGGVSRSFGSRVERYHFGQTAVDENDTIWVQSIAARGYRHRLGWPLRCLESTEWFFHGGRDRSASALFRYEVRWLGLFGNWTIFSAILVGLMYGPRWIRARRRLRMKCCAGCGYPFGRSAVCTECGLPLSNRGLDAAR